MVKGMMVTLKHLFKRPITTQYPEQRLIVSRRIRGNELVWDNKKCTGCATCAKTCPQGVIKIATSVDPKQNKFVVTKFEVDTGYCISCGLCVESCPYSALFMGYAFERAKYRRNELVQQDQVLVSSDKHPASAYAHPEIAANLPKQTLLLERDKK